MIVRSRRRYDFGADRARVWEAMAAVDEFRTWWPWLRRFEGEGLAAGERWRCSIQPPLPYVMRFTVAIDEVVEQSLIRATVGGDVTGTVRIELADHEDGCRVHLVSALEPDSGWVRALTFVGRPLVTFGHDWVLDTGARQFYDRAIGR
jgi:uncharacterized protein YndB with AHSA1/START domain